MKWRFNDAEKARLWPKEHWHVALYGLGVLAFVTAVLVELHVLTERAAVAAFLASVVYVLLTTWQYTRGDNGGKKGPEHG